MALSRTSNVKALFELRSSVANCWPTRQALLIRFVAVEGAMLTHAGADCPYIPSVTNSMESANCSSRRRVRRNWSSRAVAIDVRIVKFAAWFRIPIHLQAHLISQARSSNAHLEEGSK